MFTQAEINKRYQSSVRGNEIHRVGVAVGLINKRKEILLEKRKDCGWWGVTGGKLDLGETIEDCALREIYEETGAKIYKKDLIFVGNFSNPNEGRILQYPERRVHLVDVVYICLIDIDEFQISDESIELRFFNINELPSHIVPPAINPLKKISQILIR